MIVVSLALLLACTPTALLDFAIPKWNADSHVRIEDAYKWIYQATRGGEHAAPDREMARQWLADEWSTLGSPKNAERLWEPLCTDESIGRLNLRVFKANGGKMDDVLDAFMASSREYKEKGTSFLDTWSELGIRLQNKAIGSMTFADWFRLNTKMKAENYPAIHHSKTFEKAHDPAYRILTVEQARPLIRAR